MPVQLLGHELPVTDGNPSTVKLNDDVLDALVADGSWKELSDGEFALPNGTPFLVVYGGEAWATGGALKQRIAGLVNEAAIERLIREAGISVPVLNESGTLSGSLPDSPVEVTYDDALTGAPITVFVTVRVVQDRADEDRKFRAVNVPSRDWAEQLLREARGYAEYVREEADRRASMPELRRRVADLKRRIDALQGVVPEALLGRPRLQLGGERPFSTVRVAGARHRLDALEEAITLLEGR